MTCPKRSHFEQQRNINEWFLFSHRPSQHRHISSVCSETSVIATFTVWQYEHLKQQQPQILNLAARTRLCSVQHCSCFSTERFTTTYETWIFNSSNVFCYVNVHTMNSLERSSSIAKEQCKNLFYINQMSGEWAAGCKPLHNIATLALSSFLHYSIWNEMLDTTGDVYLALEWLYSYISYNERLWVEVCVWLGLSIIFTSVVPEKSSVRVQTFLWVKQHKILNLCSTVGFHK